MRGFSISRALAVLRIMLSSVGRSRVGEPVRALLLDESDLRRDQWKRSKEHTYAVGAGRPLSDEARRARKEGKVSVLRSFQKDNPKEIVWTSLTPYASPADAQAVLPGLVASMVRNPRTDFTITSSQVMEDKNPGSLAESVVYEEQFESKDGIDTTVILAGAVGDYVVVINFTAYGGPYSWEEVNMLFTRQLEKVQGTRGSR
jgi:hypothetical protein